MWVLRLSFISLAALNFLSFCSVQASDYDGYRHEKTKGTLPKGAPLPDIEIPKNDTITPERAYETARKYLNNNCQIEATEYYERAISALRRTKGAYDKNLAKNIVLHYGRLLRAHSGTEKANELEKEFILK